MLLVYVVSHTKQTTDLGCFLPSIISFLSLFHSVSNIKQNTTSYISGGKLAKNNFCNGLFGPAHFLWLGILNKTPLGLKYLKHKSILFTEELLAAAIKAANITSFNVSCLSDRLSVGAQVFRKLKTCLLNIPCDKILRLWRSQRNTPFISFAIIGCFPITKPSTVS